MLGVGGLLEFSVLPHSASALAPSVEPRRGNSPSKPLASAGPTAHTSPDGEARPGLARRLGLIGGVLVLVCGALELDGLHLDAVVQALLTAPVAVYEMVLAVRLILRGLDEPVIVVGS